MDRCDLEHCERSRPEIFWRWASWRIDSLEFGELHNIYKYVNMYIYIYRYDILNFMFQLCYFLDELVTRFEFFRYKKSKKSISDYLYTAFS